MGMLELKYMWSTWNRGILAKEQYHSNNQWLSSNISDVCIFSLSGLFVLLCFKYSYLQCLLYVSSTLLILNFAILFRCWKQCGVMTILAWSIAGICMADFASGFVHWLTDSYGTGESPGFAQGFIYGFRIHHVHPRLMDSGRFIQNNIHYFGLMMPKMSQILWRLFVTPSNSSTLRDPKFYGRKWFWTLLSIYISFVNQIHIWSHVPEENKPAIISFLQTTHIILPREHHQIHHAAPFDNHYCMATGWTNALLDGVGFWKGLESVVFSTSGLEARADLNEFVRGKVGSY